MDARHAPHGDTPYGVEPPAREGGRRPFRILPRQYTFGFSMELAANAPPEWLIVQAAIERSRTGDPRAWDAFIPCRTVEIYTDGSAPIANPRGPAGFAAVVVGFAEETDPDPAERPAPCARLDLSGYIPARRGEPPTSNNRAEIAGVLAALAVLGQIDFAGRLSHPVSIFSDSDYTVRCGTGLWQRKKNTDLWEVYDRLEAEARARLPRGIALTWVKGHAGNQYNEAADVLATRAAFNFDEKSYLRLRARQRETGQEMPGASPTVPPAPDAPPAPETPALADPTDQKLQAIPPDWLPGADYTLILHSRADGSEGTGPAGGRYAVAVKDGRRRHETVQLDGEPAPDEAEYRTLIAALTDLIERIDARGRDPKQFALIIYSSKEVMVKQLNGTYRVRAANLQPLYAEARQLLDRFKTAEVIWKQAQAIEDLLQ